MNRLLLFFLLLFFSVAATAQPNYLFIKKGVNKKKTYGEGDRIHLLLLNGEHKKGIITMLRDSTIYINGFPVPQQQIGAIIFDNVKKKPFPADLKTMLLIGGGVGLTTLGLSLNDQNKPSKALLSAAVIGYGPLLLKHFGGRFFYMLQRKKYKLGKKFRLQVFDLYVPNRRAF